MGARGGFGRIIAETGTASFNSLSGAWPRGRESLAAEASCERNRFGGRLIPRVKNPSELGPSSTGFVRTRKSL